MVPKPIFLTPGCRTRGAALVFLFLLLPGLFTPRAWARVDLQPCQSRVPPEKQVELGKKVAAQVYEQMPVLPDSSPVTEYVQSVGEKLAAYTPGYRWPFRFHVVDAADINAFALPGGEIFVNLGTIQAAEDEAQLAAVMAHEMSHVVLQHSICNMQKQQPLGVVAGLGQLAARVVLGNGTLGGLAQETIGAGFGLAFLRMSRGDEKQADEEGVQVLYDAGYDPRAMPQFFEVIEGKYGKGGAQFLSDHPNPGNRTEYINEEIRNFPPRTHPVTDTPTFRQIHQQVAKMRAYTAKEIASGAWKHGNPNQTVSTGIDQYDMQSGPDGGSVDLTPPTAWTTLSGEGFSLQVPSDWRLLGNRESAMIAPPGGIRPDASGQAANLVYGLMTDVYTPAAGTPREEAFAGLLNQLTQENSGMEPKSTGTAQVAGQTVPSVESETPSANEGRGEHDWIVGVPSGTGLRYFVFVAPEPDFSRLRPTFQHILQSIRLR